ncbi:hypothetical protein E2C01_054862 [Portunus trituberculatus]|uniref:Uncharacterized protein n=1 Tax=Portunus trituberculatus TaxID=210409 RepID=A0A5B7GTT1_PORTR|nr:hypothetical protein [Portunus trituberculatus]
MPRLPLFLPLFVRGRRRVLEGSRLALRYTPPRRCSLSYPLSPPFLSLSLLLLLLLLVCPLHQPKVDFISNNAPHLPKGYQHPLNHHHNSHYLLHRPLSSSSSSFFITAHPKK